MCIPVYESINVHFHVLQNLMFYYSEIFIKAFSSNFEIPNPMNIIILKEITFAKICNCKEIRKKNQVSKLDQISLIE